MTGPKPPCEILRGSVERVTFHAADESGFCVLRVAAKGRRDQETLVGHAAAVRAGEEFTAFGNWRTDLRHGRQFAAERIELSPPAGIAGVERYLASGLVKGIGKVLAGRLAKAFGARALDVIENEPELLVGVRGIGAERARRIREAWERQKSIQRIMVFLHEHGASTSRAVRIHKTYGDAAIERIQADPYALARDVWGIGFKTADAVAKTLDIVGDDPRRLRAGVSHALSSATDEGHCGMERGALAVRVRTLLSEDGSDISKEAAERGISDAEAGGEASAVQALGAPCVFLTSLLRQETRIARRLGEMAAKGPVGAVGGAKEIDAAEARAGVELSPSQRAGLEALLGARVGILTGGPGVGKTTCTKILVDVLESRGLSVSLAAPTGKAAKRLAEATGRKAATLHRLMGAKPGSWARNADNPLDLDVLVLDECSMVDVPLMHAALDALPPWASLILVGDPDQLPSVGPGNVFGDLIACGRFATARLVEIHRQAAGSLIVANAHRINTGTPPDLSNRADGDFFFLDADDAEAAAALIPELVAARLPKRYGFDPVRDVQVISPMKRGAAGTQALNRSLQDRLNPATPDKAEVERFGTRFRVGDKVMQQRNDYDLDVMNGEGGIVVGIDPLESELSIEIDGRVVVYSFDDLDELDLSYAFTIHKSQGGEAPCIVIPLAMQHYAMLDRGLLYTAITRGRKLVVVVGQRKALFVAARNVRASKRLTWLSETLGR